VTALFRRVVNVAVAPKTEGAHGGLGAIEKGLGFELSNLHAIFSAKKNLKPEPNTCKVRIFNLAPETRRVLETSKKLVLRLEAGYPNLVAQLFLGEVRSAHTTRQGPDLITEIDTGDSEKDLQAARIHMVIGPKVPTSVAIAAIARSIPVGQGNVAQVVTRLNAKGSAIFGPGTVLSGSSAQLLTDICRSADLEWSIDDGVLQILDRGKALNDKAVSLSSETGLVGSPTVDHKGIVSALAFIQPDLRPGRKVAFDSLDFRGGYKIQECEYVGDTHGNEWFVKLACRKY
jgi:hypothetical protein